MRKLLPALLLLLASLPILPQTGTGEIQGTIKDGSGAVVPSAKVMLVHVATGRQYETASNAVGFFVLPALQPGDYRLGVQVAGMDKWEGALLLQVSQTAVVNPVLKVSGTATEIVVAGDVTPLVTTTSSTLSNVVERTRIEELPLNGRFLQNITNTTTPGIEAGELPRVYGMREGSMEFLQDGAVLNSLDKGAMASRPPGLDTIQEFTVETSTSSAKMNRPASTIVSTKSGTNQVHGSAFETARNNGIGVARQRQDFYEKPPHLVRNEFGISLGGPVYLPKFYDGRNRTFFFFAYEGYRNLQSVTTANAMPSMLMRQGDFSQLVDSSGRIYPIYDPWSTGPAPTWTRTPYPGNIVPIGRESPVAKHYLSITPIPTLPNVNPLVSNNYFGPSPNNRLAHTETTRIDHRLSNRDQLFGRYSHGHDWTFVRNNGSGNNGAPATIDNAANVDIVPCRNESAVISWTHTFSPTFFSETMANGSMEDRDFHHGVDSTNYADKLGMPNPFHMGGLPDVTKTGTNMWWRGYAPRQMITKIINLDQNFTKIHGRHEFQFGGHWRIEPLQVLPDQTRAQGDYTFTSNATGIYDPKSGSSYSALSHTGHDFANFFLGLPDSWAVFLLRGWYNLRANEYAGYFQDNFKVTSRLTLNLGMRVELVPPYREANNLLSGFDLKTHAVVNGASIEKMIAMGATTPEIVDSYRQMGIKFETPQEAGLPDSLIHSNRPDFNPRAGFAYRVFSGKRSTVLRGGYAIFSSAMPMRTFYEQMRINAPVWAQFKYLSTSSAYTPDGLPNYYLRSVPTVVMGVNSQHFLDPGTVPFPRGSLRTTFFNPDQPTTRAQEWNLTLEREIFDNMVARIGYVGNHGSHLEQIDQINGQPNTYVWYRNTGLPLPTGEYASVARRGLDNEAYGDIQEYNKTGWSNFNGLQFEVRRRYARGYGFQFFYVLSNIAKAGGLGTSDYDSAGTPDLYLAGSVPADYNARNRLLNYQRDTSIPQHRVRWNWVVDLPFGRGKKFGGSAGAFWNRVIGGWQIAGFGSLRSNMWSLPTSNWGSLGKVEIYGLKYPIQDCRSGGCVQGYLYWNGYIPANRINSYDPKTGKPNGVMGVPDSYRPSSLPVWPTPKDGGSSADPSYSNYESNNVYITLKNGTTSRTSIDTNLHPWRNQYFPGPWSRGLDASLFKAIPIKEEVMLRFNADFFNVLNMPGMNQPGSNGILSLQNSATSARQLQLTLRLTW